MNAFTANPSRPLDNPRNCQIVVLYDGTATRARAMVACDYLVGQFWEDVELSFHWWRTDFLRDPAFATVAAANAIDSDFLIICSGTEHELSPALEQWFETWLERRGNHLGALVDLGTVQERRSISSSPERERLLRDICRRGSFDYLTAFSTVVGNAVGENSVPRMGGALEESNREGRPPSHYGLNE
jgi:hypothetical protein